MCFSPACRWVGWQHYIQCHPSQHRRSRPHTSPLASGSLAHMRWCTGFIEGGRDREDGGIKQWAKVENKEESRASKHKYLWVGKTNKTHDWNWKLDTATEKVFLHIFTSFKKGGGRQCTADKSVKNQRHGDTLLMHTALVFFPPRPSPGELPRHSLPPRCLQWNKVKPVWRQLQLPFGHASLNRFKYTLTCAHPLMGATKIACIFFQLLRAHTQTGLSPATHTKTLCAVYTGPIWFLCGRTCLRSSSVVLVSSPLVLHVGPRDEGGSRNTRRRLESRECKSGYQRFFWMAWSVKELHHNPYRVLMCSME